MKAIPVILGGAEIMLTVDGPRLVLQLTGENDLSPIIPLALSLDDTRDLLNQAGESLSEYLEAS